jgi:hypothetical protein
VTAPLQIHCHLLWQSADPWDLEQSLFSLLTQEHRALSVTVHAPPEQEGPARASLGRLAPLAPAIPLSLAAPTGASAHASALALWIAGTVATPDHFARCQAALGEGVEVVVAPMRRMRLRRQPEGPPFVVSKHWRWTSAAPSLAEVTADPAGLGRCLVRATAAPDRLPTDAEAQRQWLGDLWARASPRRVEGPPTIDLPDLRPEAEPDTWRDRAADLRYQLPRRLERVAPLAFQQTRRLFRFWMGGAPR